MNLQFLFIYLFVAQESDGIQKPIYRQKLYAGVVAHTFNPNRLGAKAAKATLGYLVNSRPAKATQ